MLKLTEDKEARLTSKEIDKILEDKWRHDFTKKAMPQLITALLEAQLAKFEALGYHKDVTEGGNR